MIWPGNAAFGLTVSVDVDGDLPLLADSPANIDRAKSRSVGLYGPEHGAQRILDLLGDVGIQVTWFFPGQMAERYPVLVQETHAAGHAVGVHGHRHLDFDRIDLESQVAEMIDGRHAIATVTGEAPRGFRTPAGEWSAGFPEAMADAGFAWSSSLPSDDLPFPLTGTPLIEIPFRYELEDQQYLGYNLDPPFPPGQSRITPLEIVEDNWWCEVEGAARYGTLVHLRLNAEVIGTPGRARMLRRFLTAVLARGDVWTGTCDDVAAHAQHTAADPQHPYPRFLQLSTDTAQ